ncbi:hypothetical protein Q1695_007750 [Nippostrongylus brasiliensis]|nr:hypothetical protein Q1695_007750 [Nippostrongylus brasiliensis]
MTIFHNTRSSITAACIAIHNDENMLVDRNPEKKPVKGGLSSASETRGRITTTTTATSTNPVCSSCAANSVQAVATTSVIPLPGFLAQMATIRPEAPNTAGCIVLTIVCPPGANNLMLVNLGIPVITVPIVGGIAATLTCATDGAWRTLNLPMFQIGMSITRVWCLVPMAPGR